MKSNLVKELTENKKYMYLEKNEKISSNELEKARTLMLWFLRILNLESMNVQPDSVPLDELNKIDINNSKKQTVVFHL